MRVLVAMTVFNAGRYLSKAIDSVLAQTFEDWGLMIMDDGSTDPLVSETLRRHQRNPKINMNRCQPTVKQRRASVRYATLINRAVAATDSEHVTYLCGDDFYMPDRLERMVALLDAGNDVVYGAQELLDGRGVLQGIRNTDGVLDDAFHRVDLNSVMHTRASFDAVDGFPTDPTLWRNADAHMWRRLTSVGYRFVPVPGPPTDAKHYRADSVDQRVIDGLEPWA